MAADTPDEKAPPTDKSSDQSLCRRRFLALTGAAATVGAAGLATQTGVARADSHGYGAGGYGEGPYGGVDAVEAPTVSTKYVAFTTDTTATVCGQVGDFGDARYAHCYFEWRQTGDDEWQRTIGQTRTLPGVWGTRLTGLEADTAYEFRVVAATSVTSPASGTAVGFRTRP